VNYRAQRELPARAGYRQGDVLVLFGELLGRGYANGVVEEARRAGMTILGATVGRRDAGGALRPLSDAELEEAEARLGGRIVNVPLEAGFDLDPAGDGPSPAEQLKAARPDAWQSLTLDWDLVQRSREAGARRLERALESFVAELDRLLPRDCRVLFVHTMAGGFPRARVYMPLLNRIVRGTGDKYLSSAAFWASDLGKLCAANFEEVTGLTLGRLVSATAPLRRDGRRVRYVAYGYHGCEVLVGGRFTWQSYVPYLQGWAKMRLEKCAEEAFAQGVPCTVFNCPEIWTNSSALFLGVEVSLYPLARAIREAGGGSPPSEELLARCADRLAPEASLDALLARAEAFLSSPVMASFRDLGPWPQHATREQLEAMLAASEECLAMSADPKEPLCAELSRMVFRAVGRLIFDASEAVVAPALWLNHDVVSHRLVSP